MREQERGATCFAPVLCLELSPSATRTWPTGAIRWLRQAGQRRSSVSGSGRSGRGINTGSLTEFPRLSPALELPHGEAANVQMERIQSGHPADMLKLHLGLAVVMSHKLGAQRTREPDPGAGPGAIRPSGRKRARPDRCLGSFAQDVFVSASAGSKCRGLPLRYRGKVQSCNHGANACNRRAIGKGRPSPTRSPHSARHEASQGLPVTNRGR